MSEKFCPSTSLNSMTLGMNNPLVVTSIHARATVEKQQKEFTVGWDPLFIGYSAAVFFHTCDIKINSWMTYAKKMRGSMALEKERAESEEGKSTDETLSEAGEEMEVGNTPEQDSAETDFTAHELLQDLSGDDWANTATPPLGSPRKGLELSLTSETSKMGMKLLSAEESKRNAFEGNKWMFLNTLDEKTWRELLSEFDQRVMSETTLEDFKEELWNTVVKFGEPDLMGTGWTKKLERSY